ncbi:GNAT superfamily N-acetyltransferase [Variovorax paradoxus]|uniref:hypothetical protein n=1 Tax=Variovorax paradoxus TaxID=34073 RepID=UPI0027889AEB|nr:hypothetical protein [Variovorax paradoxus]MDQ0024336.1 GNAT superfamily N-acetyltransferase [Variovorax paradoxus]
MPHPTLSIEFKHEFVVDDREPSRYVKDIEGSVYVHYENSKVKAGRFAVFVIDAEAAVNEQEDVFDCFDHSERTVDYFDLYLPHLDFKPKVVKLLTGGERWAPNILILDRLEILPRFRGRGVGLRTLRWLQFQFGTGCGIVAMKPFPLQFEGGKPSENAGKASFVKLGLDSFDNNFDRALGKLRAYYAKLGFVRVPGTPFMVADPMMKLPDLGHNGQNSAATG